MAPYPHHYIVGSILAHMEAQNSVERWEHCCDVFEQTYRQNR